MTRQDPSLQYGGRAAEHAGPTAARILLGAQLRRMRETAGFTREEAGHAIRASGSKISRLELGRTGFKLRDVNDLLSLYGIHDDGDRAIPIALAQQANTPGWWRAYCDVVPSWCEPYLGMEQAARLIRCFDVQFVPSLLQTQDYARAVIRLAYSDATRTEIDLRLALLMRRQELLHQPDPHHLWAIIDEAVLRRPTGDAGTMREQIRHMIELCQLRHVTIQVLPFSAGGHPAVSGAVALRFAEGRLPDVVYLEQLNSAVYLDKPADTLPYLNVFNSLATEAEDPVASIQTMHRLLNEM